MSDNLIILADRIKEISYTQGATSFELVNGAANGFSSFSSVYQDGDVLFYAATNGIDYEVGSGVFQAANVQTATPDTIIRYAFRSSNSSAPINGNVNWGNGAKEVYVTYPATHSVYIGSGVGPLNFPQASGIAFWSSSNILNYDNDVIWDSNNKRLGIRRSNPQHGIDIGGSSAESSVQASGFYVGEDGLVFPAANNGDINYPGGSQVVHFLPNELDSVTQTDQVFELSGVVNEYILFQKQPEGTFLAGPINDSCEGGCDPDYPIFRNIYLSDIVDLDSLDANYVSVDVINGASGVLRQDLENASGVLRSDFESADTAISNDLVEASGALRTSINEVIPTFTVTNDSTNYVFSGAGTNSDLNPTLRLNKGVTYKFIVDSVGQPFHISSSGGYDINVVFNDGVTGNAVENGELVFTVPQDAPEKLYYVSSASTTMVGTIYTSDVNVNSFNNYDFFASPDNTAMDDSVVVWDNSESVYKNLNLGDLLYAPSGNSYIKHETIGSADAAGDLGEVTFDDSWAYFKTSDGWKRVRIQTFETTTTTTAAPTTTTPWPPNCTILPLDCGDGTWRSVTGVDQDGCPIYSECATTPAPPTTTTTTLAPTTTPEPPPATNYVYTWGYNGNNQLGYRTTDLFAATPTRLEIGNIGKLSTSSYHALALDADSKLYAWGWNNQGQIGDGTKVDVPVPIIINPSQTWTDIAAGDYHSAAISSGKLYTWGYNINGQLGNGTRIGYNTPTQVGTATNWTKVYCGTSHTLAINSLGELFAWGSNEYGQVGNGTFEDVLTPTKIGAGSFWTDISAYMHTLGVNREGQLFAWGRNKEGQLGVLKTVVTVDQNGNQTVALETSLENKSVPTAVSKTPTLTVEADTLVVDAGTRDNWLSVAAGYKHSLAINQAGELYVCGTNSYGSIGMSDNTTVAAFYRLTEERNWLKVSAGNYHSIIINAAGDLYATGRNNYGQLGDGTTTNITSVTLISTDYDWDFPSTGYDFTAAIGNIKQSVTTTEAPMTFTNSVTVEANGQVAGDGGVFVLGTEGDEVHYNIPDTQSALPLSADVYKDNVYLFTFTATAVYAGTTVKHVKSSDGSETLVVLADGRVDV